MPDIAKPNVVKTVAPRRVSHGNRLHGTREVKVCLWPISLKTGVTGIGPILITAYSDNYTASAKLVKRLRSHFANV